MYLKLLDLHFSGSIGQKLDIVRIRYAHVTKRQNLPDHVTIRVTVFLYHFRGGLFQELIFKSQITTRLTDTGAPVTL